MNTENQDDRLFGTLSVIVLSMALLVPWVIAAFSREEAALGFGIVGIILALVFGGIGWRHRAGKVTVGITGVLVAFALILGALFSLVLIPKRRAMMIAERERMEQRDLEIRQEIEAQKRSEQGIE